MAFDNPKVVNKTLPLYPISISYNEMRTSVNLRQMLLLTFPHLNSVRQAYLDWKAF